MDTCPEEWKSIIPIVCAKLAQKAIIVQAKKRIKIAILAIFHFFSKMALLNLCMMSDILFGQKWSKAFFWNIMKMAIRKKPWLELKKKKV